MDYFSNNQNKYMLSTRSDLPRKETNIYLDILWYNRKKNQDLIPAVKVMCKFIIQMHKVNSRK